MSTLVSFSGIDGSGKSTQIEALSSRLREAGLSVRVLTFWDDIALLRNFREFSSHAVFNGQKGVGSPGNPVDRRDKNIQSWYMTVFRCFLYFLDALRLGISARRARASQKDVVIFDRYLYDELANLPLTRSLVRAYVRQLLKLVPRPDVACLLDAEPEQARIRKPEYPLEFVRRNRLSYLALSELVGGMTVIDPLPAPQVAQRVLGEVLKTIASRQGQLISNLQEPAVAGLTAPVNQPSVSGIARH